MEAKLFVPGVRALLGRMKPAIMLLLAFAKLIMQIQRDYAVQHILIEIICPYNIKSKTIVDSIKECQFLVPGLFYLSKKSSVLYKNCISGGYN